MMCDAYPADRHATYGELQVTSNFSFLQSGSHPDELVGQAKALGLSGLALTDRNTLAGVVRAHVAAKTVGLPFLVGVRLDLLDGPSLLCFPRNRAAYGRLCRLLTLGQRRAEKGDCHLYVEDVVAHRSEQVFVILPPDDWAWLSEKPQDADLKSEGSSLERPANRSACISPRNASASNVIPLRLRHGGRDKADHPRAHLFALHGASCGTRANGSDQAGGFDLTGGAHQAGDDYQAAPFSKHVAYLSRVLRQPLQTPDLNQPQDDASDLETRIYLAAQMLYRGDDVQRLAALQALSTGNGVPLVATGDVLYHARHRKPLHDVLTCVRHGVSVETAGYLLKPHSEHHLKSPQEMRRLFCGFEDCVARTSEIFDACCFSLDELEYEYPDEPVPEGVTPQAHLENLTYDGAKWRYPNGVPETVAEALKKELKLIAQLKYAPYFLTVQDIVAFARSRNILAQGRGSAANSAVCYCLGITAVDPS
ncbi:MAG: PHP domain-containing protein, partial [Pseudomonadota bacterium]